MKPRKESPTDKWSKEMSRRDIKKTLGLSDENFSFYVKGGYIKRKGRGSLFMYLLDMHNMILERSTVFKYCFEDSYQEDMREFIDVVKHTSTCKILKREDLDPEIIKQYEQRANEERKKEHLSLEDDEEDIDNFED